MHQSTNMWHGQGWIDRRRTAGLCKFCVSPLMANSRSYCEEHWFVNLSINRLGSTKYAKELKLKLERQNHKCALSGDPLTIGINCSLDHIKPIARYPELKGDINNVQWVTHDVNLAKRALATEDFIAFCKRIARKAGAS